MTEPTSPSTAVPRLRRARDFLYTAAAGAALLVATVAASSYAPEHPDGGWAIAVAWLLFLAASGLMLFLLAVQQNKLDAAPPGAEHPADPTPELGHRMRWLTLIMLGVGVGFLALAVLLG
jgi:hypothetical protein